LTRNVRVSLYIQSGPKSDNIWRFRYSKPREVLLLSAFSAIYLALVLFASQPHLGTHCRSAFKHIGRFLLSDVTSRRLISGQLIWHLSDSPTTAPWFFL